MNFYFYLRCNFVTLTNHLMLDYNFNVCERVELADVLVIILETMLRSYQKHIQKENLLRKFRNSPLHLRRDISPKCDGSMWDESSSLIGRKLCESFQ